MPDINDVADFSEHRSVFAAVEGDTALKAQIAAAIELCADALAGGHKLLFCGNGGSAADCQHLATELTIRYIRNRPALAALSLATDTSALTAAGNDLGFDVVFSRQIEALGRPGDILLAFSTSGNSPNIVKAIEAARAGGLKVVFFGGGSGGQAAPLSDVRLIVPSKTTARIQEMHILFGHILCGQIEERLNLTGA